MFSQFYEQLTLTYSNNIIIHKNFKSKRNKYDKPWISEGIAKSCKTKNKLHNKWIKSRGNMTENFNKTEYKSYRSKLRNLIRLSEENYYKAKFAKTCGDIKKAWKVINSIRCKSKSAKFPNTISQYLISFLPLSYTYHDYHPSPLSPHITQHNASQLTHHHINTMTTSHSPADDGRKNSSESSCYAYIYCYFYVLTQLYKSLKYQYY